MDTQAAGVGKTSSRIEAWKVHGRRRAGKVLHKMGAYRALLPFRLKEPRGIARRLQSYLMRYYESETHAEAVLELPELETTFACDIRDHMLWWHVADSGDVYELAEIEHCRAHVRPGDHILDVGANHGFWGFALAKRAGRSARLYLAEANPQLVRRLQKTAALNPSVAASILPYAVSDGHRDQVEFYLPPDNLSGLGSTVLNDFARQDGRLDQNGYLDAGRHTAVPAVSIDQLLSLGLIHGIDLLKIDVEGAEDAVLRGATNALDRFTPRLIMVETSNQSATFRALCDRGYQPYLLRPDGRQGKVDPHEYYWGNVFFEPRDGSTG